MAVHSSILAWKIPWMEGPGRIQSVGLQRVRHDLLTENGRGWMAVSLFATVIIIFYHQLHATNRLIAECHSALQSMK